MTETFYGPWSIVVISNANPADFWERFFITGSDASDGVYAGVPGVVLAAVSGSAWTIAIETRVPLLPNWLPTKARRSANYTIQGGLLVHLVSDDDSSLTNMVLVCRSLDPMLNPMQPTANPYSFTISDRALSRYRRHGRPPHRRTRQERRS